MGIEYDGVKLTVSLRTLMSAVSIPNTTVIGGSSDSKSTYGMSPNTVLIRTKLAFETAPRFANEFGRASVLMSEEEGQSFS